MRLADLKPRFVGAGGVGVYRPTGRACPTCPAGAAVDECRSCFGRGTEFEPEPERTGVGLSFLCPCPRCVAERAGDDDADFRLRVYVRFRNPLDGGPAYGDGPSWERRGSTFEDLVLQPSILSVEGQGGCGWHGYVGGPGGDRPGEVVTV